MGDRLLLPDVLHLVDRRCKASLAVAVYEGGDVVVTARRFAPDVVREALASSSRLHRAGAEGGLCTVCQAEFARGERCRTLACGHGFHRRCIDRWARERGGACCPVCRCDQLAGLRRLAAPAVAAAPRVPVHRVTVVHSDSEVARFLQSGWASPRASRRHVD